MKYKIESQTIPKELREKINEKIIYIINNNLTEKETGITKNDIFNSYTGRGGLHNLNYNDYSNYYSYKKDKQEIEQGQFFTPYSLVNWIMDCLKPKQSDLIADLTCGHGAFINSAPNEINFYGCELDYNSYLVAKYLYPEAKLVNGDIREYSPQSTFDYVIGNPPYGLKWIKNNINFSSELYYCIKAYELLKPCGILAIIVPYSFCNDEFSNKSDIEALNEKFNYVVQIALDKNSFKHLGVENYKTKLLILQKKSEHTENIEFKNQVLNLSNSNLIYSKYICPLVAQKDKLKQKLLLENIKSGDYDFQYKVRKLMYDIKNNPKTKKYLADCQEYIDRFKNQKQPAYMNYEEWEKTKVTSKGVLEKLKYTLQLQHPQRKKENVLIKDKYNLRLKDLKIPIYKAVAEEYYPFEDTKYKKLIDKKIKQYHIQSKKFNDMKIDPKIESWLKNFELKSDSETIKLNPLQLHDTNLFLQKPYAFVQWEQGSGKTITGITQAEYRLKHNNVRNVFIVSTAIAIKTNWNDVLKAYGKDFCNIEKLSDINNIKKGQYVTITLNMMCKYHRQIKKYIKMQSQKVMLIFDESDNISQTNSKRTKAVLNAFRKVKYKLLMTGTSTRNNVAEIIPQIELLYNNSYNMISTNDYIYKRDKQNLEELLEQVNEYKNKPIPAYNKGYKLFKESHIPEKITVFGLEKLTQDIYNLEDLKALRDKTIITRTFEEVTGKKLYEIKHVSCIMNEAEKSLYTKAIEKFYEMEYLFSKTGNSRKDAILKILKQLILMLKICASSQIFKEYESSELPEKFKKVIKLVNKFKDQRVAIGVRHIEVANEYYKEIKKQFPNRQVFLITGDKTSLEQRKSIVNELKATKNGILISTQQSLSASMNIDFVDKCIIAELHWNNAGMSQYYFRFIRYTSTRFKEVYFVTYKNSIETNLLKMILTKDKLNLIMKNKELADEEIEEKFGIDSDVLKNLMYKEQTDDGVKIRWGEQKVS